MTHDTQHKHNLALSPSAPFQSNLPLVSVTTWLSVTVFLFILRLAYLTRSFKKRAVFQRINQGCQVQCIHLSWTWFHVRCIALFLLAVGRHGRWAWLAPTFIFSSSLPTNVLIQAFVILSGAAEVWKGRKKRTQRTFAEFIPNVIIKQTFLFFCESFKTLISGDSFMWINLVRLIFIFLSHLWLPSSVLNNQMWGEFFSQSTIWFLVSSSYQGIYVHDVSEIYNHCVKAKLHC